MKSKLMAAALIAGGLLLGSTAFAQNYTVKMLNQGTAGTFTFEPAYLHVQPGDTVTFEPTDAGHDSVAYFAPEGATKWQGEVGKKVTVTLTKEGVYLYECKPHHMFGMLGVIQVGEATNKTAAAAAAKKMEGQQMMNKDRLPGLMAQIK